MTIEKRSSCGGLQNVFGQLLRSSWQTIEMRLCGDAATDGRVANAGPACSTYCRMGDRVDGQPLGEF